MADQLSGITIIYLIAIGVQVFILLFIFGKRQIMRFAWSYRKVPHAPVGQGAPKSLKRQTLNYITAVGKIYYEPSLADNFSEESPHWYRYKTVDEFRHLYRELSEANIRPVGPLPPSCPLSKFVACLRDNEWLANVSEERIDRMTFLYNKARYTSEPFSREEFIEFSKILASIVADVRRKHQSDYAVASAKAEGTPKRWSLDNRNTSKDQQLKILSNPKPVVEAEYLRLLSGTADTDV